MTVATVRVLRHPKENRRKCSLEPLVGDPRFEFVRWHPSSAHDATGYTLLEIDAPVLTGADAGRPLLILDSTWRYLPKMRQALRGLFAPRSLPAALATAYPRVARLSRNPDAGLASIEAVYAALRILGQRDDTLLDSYRWKDDFLATCARVPLP